MGDRKSLLFSLGCAGTLQLGQASRQAFCAGASFNIHGNASQMAVVLGDPMELWPKQSTHRRADGKKLAILVVDRLSLRRTGLVSTLSAQAEIAQLYVDDRDNLTFTSTACPLRKPVLTLVHASDIDLLESNVLILGELIDKTSIVLYRGGPDEWPAGYNWRIWRDINRTDQSTIPSESELQNLVEFFLKTTNERAEASQKQELPTLLREPKAPVYLSTIFLLCDLFLVGKGIHEGSQKPERETGLGSETLAKLKETGSKLRDTQMWRDLLGDQTEGKLAIEEEARGQQFLKTMQLWEVIHSPTVTEGDEHFCELVKAAYQELLDNLEALQQ